ncbi:MAG: DUF1127 domain-containing protein [Pseudomonadota bacterium]
MAATSDFSAARSLEVSGFAAMLDALKTRLQRYRTYRQTISELGKLSSRELNDLGLNHTMIRQVAYQSVYDHVDN